MNIIKVLVKVYFIILEINGSMKEATEEIIINRMMNKKKKSVNKNLKNWQMGKSRKKRNMKSIQCIIFDQGHCIGRNKPLENGKMMKT